MLTPTPPLLPSLLHFWAASADATLVPPPLNTPEGGAGRAWLSPIGYVATHCIPRRWESLVSANTPPPTRKASSAPAAVKATRSRKKKSPAHPKAQANPILTISDEEPANAMSESPHVHAPQHGIHTWRDFAVHIAVVTIGLLLAIGLQQIVETVHHRQQRAQLEEQMRGTFVANEQLISDSVKRLERFQSYLVDLRLAAQAKKDGRATPLAPAASDPRNFTYAPPPSLGAYEASKANGTVALLSFDTIRLYDRLGITIGVMHVDLQRYLAAVTALRSFAERFDSAPVGTYGLAPVDLARLSAAELGEYQVLIGNMLGAVEGFKTRLRILGLSSRAILDGAQTEAELRVAVAKMQGDVFSVPKTEEGDRR